MTTKSYGMTGDREWRLQVGEDELRAVLDRSTTGASHALFVFAHGAGGHMGDAGMLAATTELRARGLDVVRFNFPYRDKGSRRPDAMPRLQECVAAVAERARSDLAPRRLLVGGRSMGGRASSMLAAGGFDCDALLLLAYPLHPANEPQKLRDAHLARITVPVLCLNGTRDALCRRDLMDEVVARLAANWRMHWLEGADHSFHVTKATGRSDRDVMDEVGTVIDGWLPGVPAKS